ncbi:MAG: D-alanyl-D-alanine carboxypeptidase family protein [Dehalococcoidia bacterium]
MAPVVIGLAFVAFGLIVSGGSAELPDDSGCRGAECAPLVAGESATPLVVSPTAEARPSPGTEPAPPISGYSTAIVEEPCGAVIYAVNEHLQLPPASLTKIMTAIVALENAQADEIVDVQIDGGELSLATDSTVMGLKPGDQLAMIDLIYGLLMRSGHDAALAIADHISGDEESFAVLMNAKASALGLQNSYFTNASGLDDANLYTSAFDIAMLARELLSEPRLAEIVRSDEYDIGWDRGPLENLNLMLSFYPGAIGVKTGFTDLAGQTIVAAADRDGRRLIVSVLHSEDLYVDASALLDWAFANTAPGCDARG